MSPFKTTFFFLCSLLLPFLALAQCGPTTTLYAENNGQDGIMFDITAAVDVTILGFDCNMGETITPYNMEIYYKAGTHVGFTTTPGAWTLVGTANGVMGMGVDVPTPIPIVVNVAIPQGQTYAFYVTETGGAANIDYTNGVAVGNVAVNDGNISVLEGTGKDYAFGTDYAPRVPNMTIYYECCPSPDIVETPNSCSGLPDGSVEVIGQGTGPWVYEIADITGVLQTSPPTNGPYTFQGLIEGQYVISATDATGCTAVADAELAPAAPMVIDATVTDNLCYGGTLGIIDVEVNGGTAPIDIGWTDAFGNVLQLDPQTNGMATLAGLSAGTYLVGAMDQAGCSTTASIDVTEPVAPLVLTLTPQDLRCFESADGEVLAEQNGVAPFVYELADVLGNPLSSANNADTYTFQGLEAGVYFVTVTDAEGCAVTENVEVHQPEALSADASSTPVLCFNGNQGTATVSNISGGTTPYAQTVWNDPQQQVGNTATDLESGNYIATVSDANGCELEVAFTLNNPPPLTLTPDYLTDTCGQGKGAAIINVSLGTPPYTYLWKPDGMTTPVHYQLFEGSYEVVVSDANGCTDSTFVTVQDDIPYPFAAFDYRIEGDNELNQEVQFINNSIGTSQWSWFFGDDEFSNLEDPKHDYQRAGDYLVQLIASNGYCEDTAYRYVNIDPLLTVYVPNAFSPGENGINDFFYPQGEGIEEESYDMFIYDRWGGLVWQTGNFSKKWNGTNLEGSEVPVGTYAWVITFREFADLDRYVMKGVVHVIRD
ncbi:MAG: T9SS type B sorting domain-containing protein [Bacteroidetes bacterium]|nr:MAG: T9SS type B sorting domain-containing protein [Bacteroidota bacterium]